MTPRFTLSRPLLACCVGILWITTLSAKPLPKNYQRDSIPVLTQRCSRLLTHAYMAERKIRTERHLPGWEGFPVQLYEYHTGRDTVAGVRKVGRVYLLNPSPKKLATWIANACCHTTGALDYRHSQQLLRWIAGQSGGQFPVLGVVYEAMERPQVYYPYLFKDGVTVYLADSTWFAADQHCTEAQLNHYLTLTNRDLKPYTGRYARICSTTREQYLHNGGTEAVGRSTTREERVVHWLEVVRQLYQQAWRSDRNALIEAWARENLD